MVYDWFTHITWIGFKNLQEDPMFDGESHGFL